MEGKVEIPKITGIWQLMKEAYKESHRALGLLCITRNRIMLQASYASQGIEQYISSGEWRISIADQSPRDTYLLRLRSSTPKPPLQLSFSTSPRHHKYSGKSNQYMNCEVTINARTSW